ncbi:hypothetical protein AOLI_G00186910 [Acnodon oligacanthus]
MAARGSAWQRVRGSSCLRHVGVVQRRRVEETLNFARAAACSRCPPAPRLPPSPSPSPPPASRLHGEPSRTRREAPSDAAAPAGPEQLSVREEERGSSARPPPRAHDDVKRSHGFEPHRQGD